MGVTSTGQHHIGPTWLLDVLPPNLQFLGFTTGDHFARGPKTSRELLYVALKHVLLSNDTVLPSLTELFLEPIPVRKEEGADSSTYIVTQAEQDPIQLAESAGVSLLIPYGRKYGSAAVRLHVNDKWCLHEYTEWLMDAQPFHRYYPKTIFRFPGP